MGKAKNATKPPTDAEIWDDSALVRTWDEAVEEYKLYHSIHAKGEDIEDVLREAEDEETWQKNGSTEHTVTMGTDAKSSGVLEEDVDETAEQQQKSSEESPNTGPGSGPGSGPGPGAGTGSVGAATMPHPALSSVQDEGLKNLMMSWYFAGYYTGLYEGQQQAKS